MSQAPTDEDLEKTAHTELTVDLHDKRDRLLNLAKITTSMEKTSIEHLLKGSLNDAYGCYLMTRLLSKSLDKEFQQYFVGWGKYDEALLQYAYRGGGREEIETRFNKVEEVVKVK